MIYAKKPHRVIGDILHTDQWKKNFGGPDEEQDGMCHRGKGEVE